MAESGNLPAERQPHVPEQFRLWYINLPKRGRIAVSGLGLTGLGGGATFFYSQFIQARPPMGLVYSRAMLVALGIVLFLAFWLVSGQLFKSRVWPGLGSFLVSVVLMFALDSWVPKPQSRFSSRQTIEIASVPGQYNRTINLDNAASLILGAPFNASAVTLFWLTTALSTIVEPVPGKQYKVPGDGEGAIEFGPGVTAKEATIFRHVNPVFFDAGKHRQNFVKVGGRVFLIRLEEIRDKATHEIPMHFDYIFAVVEQDPTFENQRKAITADDFGPSQWISAFRDLPQGTIMMKGIRESVNKKPNRILLRAGGKIFWCDPAEGLVSFQMPTTSGRSISLQGQLDRVPEHKDKHFIAIRWDETKGASLFIDGHFLNEGLQRNVNGG